MINTSLSVFQYGSFEMPVIPSFGTVSRGMRALGEAPLVFVALGNEHPPPPRVRFVRCHGNNVYFARDR